LLRPLNGVVITGYDYCYFSSNSRGLKSHEMQNIHAIFWGNWAVSGLGASLHFPIEQNGGFWYLGLAFVLPLIEQPKQLALVLLEDL
jgi:hypothetical protein